MKTLKCIKTVVLVLVILLSSSVLAVFSKNDTFSVNYTFEPAIVKGGEFLVKNTQIREILGEPLIPYRAARILLPQGVAVKDVNVRSGTAIVQTGFDIPWGQPPCTFSDEPVIVGRSEKIYTSDKLYPGEEFDIVGVEYFRGFAVLNVHLFPVQYKPKSQTVYFYETMTVEVKFGKGSENKLYRGLPDDRENVVSMVDNPEMTRTYEDGPIPLQTEEYVIITNDTMQSKFQQLSDWKANFVNGTSVYTVSWITSNYSGVDNAEKIRNFIIDKYTNNGTLYVLLGGDVAAVPYRGFYVSTGGYTDADMLADMYFAHLDGNHNADGDSRWGEPNDNVDFYAEVAVGRAPCQSTAEAQTFVNKVITYEQMNKPKRVCLHQSRVQSGNSPDSRCLAWNCDDWIPGDYYIDYLFEEDGTITKAKWRDAWAASPIVVVHIGHGNTGIYYINYENGGTVSWYNSDVSSLTNTFFPWTTSVACISGQIEANDCLAEVYVMAPYRGAIAAIYNDNYGWFSLLDPCMYSGEFCENEVRACWSDGFEKFGDILNRSRYYLVSPAQSNSYYRWCFYERNLIGDPETPSLTWKPPPDTVTITYPQDGDYLSGTISITVLTTGCIDTVEFYIDGVLKYTDTTEPFYWTWDTTLHFPGPHTILVKGYCAGEFKDEDQVAVIVHPYHEVTITEPQDGEYISGTSTITVSTIGYVDTVEFYIDGVLKYTDTTEPFYWTWDTTLHSPGQHTILVKGYGGGEFRDDDQITVIVVPYYYITITEPQDGDIVKGHVWIRTDTSSYIDTVEFYIDGSLESTDTSAPFEWKWKTRKEKDGLYTIMVKGYASGEFKEDDQITVTVKNEKKSIALLSWLILILPAGIFYRRR